VVIVIGYRASAQSGAEPCLSFLVLQYCSRHRPQLETVRYLTVVTRRHNAISSLRASATIIVVLRAPLDAEFQTRVGAFLQGLQQLGWTIGRNERTDTRWGTTNHADIRRHAAELVGLAPDVILAHGVSTVGPLLQATRTVPIVFPVVGDPVAAGFVDSLARPGGNATGFIE
jgi:hypothetical protein